MIKSLINRDNFLDLNKKKAELKSDGKKEGEALVESGTIDAHEWTVRIRQLKEFLDGVEEGLFDQCLKEVADGSNELGHVKLSVANTGDRLDYEKDPVIAFHTEKIKARKELVYLASKKGVAVADPENGDEVKPVPVKTFGRQTVKISL